MSRRSKTGEERKRDVRNIYIAWTRYQRRPTSMQDDFAYELHFLPALPLRFGLMKGLFSYPVQAVRTLGLLRRAQPSVVWLQIPPSILIHIAWLTRRLSRRPMLLVADLHNSALSKFWLSVPLTRRLVNSFDIVLVHNEPTRQAAIERGLDASRLLVLEDHLPFFEATAAPRAGAHFVFPCSFYKDEPVRNVLEAARQLPDLRFMITGDRRRAQDLGYVEAAPANVVFTGFLPTPEYDRLIESAKGVLCLTTENGIQLSAASEAVGAGKPMIVSDTPLLRSLFEGGLFVDNSIEAIRDACRTVAGDYHHFAAAVLRLRDNGERRRRWHAQAARVKNLLPHGS